MKFPACICETDFT